MLIPAILLIFAVVAANAAPVDEAASVKTVKVVIDVNDMTCSLCVTSINQALRKTEGVITAKSSLKTKQAEVVIPDGFPIQNLLDAIKKTGYTGKVDRIERLP